jgi:segregation and condensation protein A
MSEQYKVELDHYNGPMDLLLYLIRREEVEIQDIPIASITEQYIAYLEVVKEIDPDHIGEFLVLAATLMEIKSRMLLPKPPPPEEDEGELIDPRRELVAQLLEYKRFKDAARELGDAAETQAKRFGRLPILLPRQNDDIDLDYLQVWDLLKAFGRVLHQTKFATHKHEVVYDDTPIALHAADILDRLRRGEGSIKFVTLFEARVKGEIIGMFLALLELVRRRRVRADQDDPTADLVIHLLDDTPMLEADMEASFAPPAETETATTSAPPEVEPQ